VTPLVSVLLPAFDAASTLAAALASIARQTLADFECIVVDDGSGDDTAAIARVQEARDGRFRVERQEHAGIVAALRRGLHHCRGNYVARMDADDLAAPRPPPPQVEWLERHRELAASRLPRAGLSARGPAGRLSRARALAGAVVLRSSCGGTR
jgi:glycosyltransferase involved in cell wall biosynthesis